MLFDDDFFVVANKHALAGLRHLLTLEVVERTVGGVAEGLRCDVSDVRGSVGIGQDDGFEILISELDAGEGDAFVAFDQKGKEVVRVAE